MIAPLFPLTWEAFLDHRLNASALSDLDRRMARELSATPAGPGREAVFLMACGSGPWASRGWDAEKSGEREECRGKMKDLGLI